MDQRPGTCDCSGLPSPWALPACLGLRFGTAGGESAVPDGLVAPGRLGQADYLAAQDEVLHLLFGHRDQAWRVGAGWGPSGVRGSVAARLQQNHCRDTAIRAWVWPGVDFLQLAGPGPTGAHCPGRRRWGRRRCQAQQHVGSVGVEHTGGARRLRAPV